MKEIPLSKGLNAIVDDEDFKMLSNSKWRATKNHNTHYAVAGSNENFRYMHRLLCRTEEGLVVDHINGDGLDNRKSNLRAVPLSINRLSSKISKNNTSGFKGVGFCKQTGRYTAWIWKDNKKIWLGRHDTIEEAKKAYMEASRIYHGEFGCDGER